MKNNHFGSLSIRLSETLKQPASFSKLGIKNISAGRVKIQYLYLDNHFFYSLLKFDRQSLSSKVIAILDLTSGSLTLVTIEH